MSRTHQSNVIYQSAMAYHQLAVIAMADDSILVTAPMAIVANLALCVELLLKATSKNLPPAGPEPVKFRHSPRPASTRNDEAPNQLVCRT